MSHRGPAATFAAVVISLAVPALAPAASTTVSMGVPTSAQKAFQRYNADVDAFFPKTTTIHVGDAVAFAPNGFHNLDLPAKGGKATALLTPTGKAAAGLSDAAGQPFWFNGQPELGFTTSLLTPAYGKSLTYDGKKGIQSGLPLGDKLKPVTVTFKKKGSFTFYCDVHPGMHAQVKVLPKTARIPTSKARKKTVAAQVSKALKTAKQLAARKAPKNRVDLGRHGADGTEILAFLPGSTSVKVGESVTFAMDAKSFEVHTATTGPGDIMNPSSYLGGIAAAFESPVFPPVGTYASEAPTAGTTTYTPALHGNGYWNSGLLDDLSQTPFGKQSTVTFGQAGTYTFYCLIHPFMKGTVTVS